MSKHVWRLYFNPRVLSVLLLGLSSGLPLVLIGSTLQAWFTTSGVSLLTIGFLGLVAQPYTWKFCWAPLLDWMQVPGLGQRRGWIVLMQSLIAFCLVIMAFYQPNQHPMLIALLALGIAFFSATQDVAIDAYRTEVLAAVEQGAGAAFYSLGYRIAMLIAGALALLVAHQVGWRVTYFFMAGVMFFCMLFSCRVPRVELTRPKLTLAQAIVSPLKDFLRRPYALMIIIFIITYKLTDAFALSLNSYFLLHVMGFSLLDLGQVSKLAGLTGCILGSVLGGLWLPRLGLFRSLFGFGVLQALSALLFVALFFLDGG
jgi:PAT family beta-lactamase induction signal transducer AmpG